MPDFPSDWVQHFGIHLSTAYPPAGGGRFRYFERLRPQSRFSAIVEQTLARDPDFKVHHVGETLRIVTHEGEYGAWVRIDGLREGSSAVRFIGAVFLGDFAAALDCIAVVPQRFAEFEQQSLNLLRRATFKMTRRPRQFFHLPPGGWQGIASGLSANYYPPDFPNNRTNIVVPPADFIESDEAALIESTFTAAAAGLSVENTQRDAIKSEAGAHGQRLRLHGRRAGNADPIFRDVVVFALFPHIYRMYLETTAAARLPELRESFLGVVSSFRPLPSAEEIRSGRAFARSALDIFNVWES